MSRSYSRLRRGNMDSTTIKVSDNIYQHGDRLTVSRLDMRRWPRFKNWVLRRPAPTVSDNYTVVDMSGTAMTIKPIAQG